MVLSTRTLLYAFFLLLDYADSLEGHGLSYHEIEQYVNLKIKVHHNTIDQ